MTLRVLSALREADVVACEDTRRTRVLLDRYGVKARLVAYHEHNERPAPAELVERMRAGETVALVSDAGMPLVSDPGYVLVRACVAAGVAVEVLPGPSAAMAALVASALPGGPVALPRASCRARRASCVGAVGAGRDAGGVRVAAPGGGDAGGAGLGGSRSPGGRVPGADKGARGGRAGNRCRAGGAVRGVAAAGGGGAGDRGRGGSEAAPGSSEPAGLDALRRLVEAGAKPRPAAAVVAELTGGRANELYRALTRED